MFLKKITSAEEVAQYLATTISAKLNNDKRVLWLVGGGSGIPLTIAASQSIQGVDSDLFISLTDERPGAVGHVESNWLQLQRAGLSYQTREYYEILQNQSIEQEVTGYDAWLGRMLASADYRIGFFGIGADGHTAGILPGDSLKLQLANAGFWDDGHRQRISLTPEAIAKLDEIVVYLSGEDKRPILDKLQTQQDPIDFPAEYLKKVAKLTVYNEWVGES